MEMENLVKKKERSRMDAKQRYFRKILHYFYFEPSRINKLPHVAYHSDPGALHVNAFTIAWENVLAFPPFAILGKALQKVIPDRST